MRPEHVGELQAVAYAYEVARENRREAVVSAVLGLGYTQREVAAASGVSLSRVNAWVQAARLDALPPVGG